MRKSRDVIIGFIVLIFGFCLIGSSVLAAEKTYTMKGEVTAIETAGNTVVVEVPLGKKTFIVGGPISAKAVLKKGKTSVELKDFKVGDKVTVRWKASDKGHIIESLQGK